MAVILSTILYKSRMTNLEFQLQMLEENTEKDKLQLDTNKAEIVRLQEQINLEVRYLYLF